MWTSHYKQLSKLEQVGLSFPSSSAVERHSLLYRTMLLLGVCMKRDHATNVFL